jgi:hypothetical protein
MFTRLKNYLLLRKARNRLILLGKMIDAIDGAFVKNKIPRWKRRQFWDDFIHSEVARKKFIQDVWKEAQDK